MNKAFVSTRHQRNPFAFAANGAEPLNCGDVHLESANDAALRTGYRYRTNPALSGRGTQNRRERAVRTENVAAAADRRRRSQWLIICIIIRRDRRCASFAGASAMMSMAAIRTPQEAWVRQTRFVRTH